jgi:hypothetical protein
MKIFAASDVVHRSLSELPAQPGHVVDAKASYHDLLAGPGQSAQTVDVDITALYDDFLAGPGQPALTWKALGRQLLPGGKYPQNLRNTDRGYLRGYREDIDALGVRPGKSSPTLLAASQRIYDGEATRRESINTRCGAVLSTAGILGALVVGAGQLGLQHKGSFGFVAGIVWFLFVVSLLYLGLSIAMALRVHGEIQGNVVGPHDLLLSGPQLELNEYNVNVAKVHLGYAVTNWCLNNDFKFRLNSAQRCLRNGIVAIIVAGMLSPLLLP